MLKKLKGRVKGQAERYSRFVQGLENEPLPQKILRFLGEDPPGVRKPPWNFGIPEVVFLLLSWTPERHGSADGNRVPCWWKESAWNRNVHYSLYPPPLPPLAPPSPAPPTPTPDKLGKPLIPAQVDEGGRGLAAASPSLENHPDPVPGWNLPKFQRRDQGSVSAAPARQTHGLPSGAASTGPQSHVCPFIRPFDPPLLSQGPTSDLCVITSRFCHVTL